MRMLIRVLGTWLLGLAVVLLVIDGTRSLAADAIVLGSLADVWGTLHPQSLAAINEFFATRLFAALLADAFNAVLAAPAFVVAGVPGLLLALAGRKRRPLRYVRSDQI